jgi:hypothetical protein
MKARAHFLTGIAALFLATGTAHAAEIWTKEKSEGNWGEPAKGKPWKIVCAERHLQDGEVAETRLEAAAYKACLAHVEIPKQYRGAWCETKWQTIYKRCPGADFEVKRTYWTTVESTCNVLSVRKSKYGGHRLLAICEGDEGSRDMPNRVEVRWWLGTNNTRLQVIVKDLEYESP